MRLRDHYDWVVLGDHPGALLSASLAARLGLSVLVLPLVPGARLTLSSSGQFLDPEPNFMVGLGRMERSNGLMAECLTRLGITPSESEFIRKEGVLPQILTPGKRVSFALEDEEFRRELDREFGDQFAVRCGLTGALAHAELPILSFWRKLPERLTLPLPKSRRSEDPGSLRELQGRLARTAGVSGQAERSWFLPRRSLAGLVDQMGETALNEICRGLWYGFTGSESADPRLAEIFHALVLARTGAAFKGGLTAYREFLIRLAKRLGAQVPPKSECRRIFVEDGRFVGVQIAQRGNMIGAGGGILGSTLSHARERISASGRSWIYRLKSSPVPAGWKFTLALTVHAEAIPPGMGARSIWMEKGAPVLDFEIAEPADFGADQPGHRLIFVRTVLPFTQASLNVDFQRMVAARMLRQLTEIMPYLEYHIVLLYPDFRTENGELSEAYGFASPDFIPENLRCLEGEGVGSRSGVEGLFVSSGESFPRLGSLGGTVAAIEAVSWLAHRSGLPGPFA